MSIGITVPLPAYYVDVALHSKESRGIRVRVHLVRGTPHHSCPQRQPLPRFFRRRYPGKLLPLCGPICSLGPRLRVTTDIKLGTGITLVPERNPLLLAKEVSTLDHFSGGRFLFGIGTGWLREETEIMGGDFDHRWTQAREAIQVMKKLWTEEEAAHTGRYYNFPPVKSYPKPFQKPHPPVLLGGMAPNVLKRIVAWADGWLPNRITHEALREKRAELNAMAAKAGRDPESLTISVHGQPSEPESVKAYLSAGANRVIIRTEPTGSEKEILAQLEQIAAAVL